MNVDIKNPFSLSNLIVSVKFPKIVSTKIIINNGYKNFSKTKLTTPVRTATSGLYIEIDEIEPIVPSRVIRIGKNIYQKQHLQALKELRQADYKLKSTKLNRLFPKA